MQSYVINLESSATRLAHMAAQMDRMGIAWTRLPAIDARTLPPSEVDAFRQQRRNADRPHAWQVGQVGALLSHMEAWRRIGTGDDPWGAVFEDDVHIDPRLAPMLRDISWIPSGADIVRFETTRQGMRLGKAQALPGLPFRFARVAAGAWGTAGYAIERNVARWLADIPPRLQAPVDWLLFHRKTTIAARLNVLQLTPAPCIQDQFLPAAVPRMGFESAIIAPAPPGMRNRAWNASARLGRGLLGKQMVEFSSAPAPH